MAVKHDQGDADAEEGYGDGDLAFQPSHRGRYGGYRGGEQDALG